jgi:hypothetical protein
MSFNGKISFIIITNGERPVPLRDLAGSLMAHSPWETEIILCGDVEEFNDLNTILCVAKEQAQGGEISILKNRGADSASGDLFCFFDDDISLKLSWFRDIEPLLLRLHRGDLDFGGCRVVGPNGRRWYDWTWASRTDPHCPTMLMPYKSRDKSIYLSGCCMLARTESFHKIRFNETKGYYQREDIDFSHRAWDAEMSLGCYPFAEITHLLEPAGRFSGETTECDYLFNRSIYQYRYGELGAAEAVLDRAGMLGLNIDTYEYTKGLYIFVDGRRKDSARYFVSVLERGSASRFQLIQSNYRLGVIRLSEGNRKEAAELFRRTIELSPDHPMARFRLERMG